MPSTNQAKDIDISEVEQQHPPSPITAESESTTNPAQKSWVWTHFKAMDKQKVECQVASKKKDGGKCKKILSRDPTGSTKSMSEHLKRVHGIISPALAKANQLRLPNLLKCQSVEARVSYFNFHNFDFF